VTARPNTANCLSVGQAGMGGALNAS
jgi:hypothetical protein